MSDRHQISRRHHPTLPTHSEDEDTRPSNGSFRHYSQPVLSDTHPPPLIAHRQNSYPVDGISSISGFQPGLPGSAVRNIPYSARQTRSQAGLAEEQNETEEGDTSSSEDGEQTGAMIEDLVVTHTAAEQRERLEWQIMLRSVLDGDVINSEKARVGIAELETPSTALTVSELKYPRRPRGLATEERYERGRWKRRENVSSIGDHG